MGAHGRHREAEAKMRELLVEAGLPEPGHVEYEGQSVYFDWVAQKLVVAIDLDEQTPRAATAE